MLRLFTKKLNFAQKLNNFSRSSTSGGVRIKSRMQRLIFDKKGYAPIFEHFKGTVTDLFTISAHWPVLGSTYKYFFITGSLFGLTGLTVLNIYSKRVVHKLYIKKTGDFIKIQFFNAFWRPKTEEFHINEMNDLRPSYSVFYKFEAVSMGNLWICLNSNLYSNNPIYESTLINSLDGQQTDLDYIEKKAKKFKSKINEKNFRIK